MKAYTLAILMLNAPWTFASLIIDTGEPIQKNAGGTLRAGVQELAGYITLDSPYTLNSIEGWMSGEVIVGTFNLMVLGSLDDKPNDLDVYFDSKADYRFGSPQGGYNGVYDIDLDLASGNYWIVFGVDEFQTFRGFMPMDSPKPLENGAARGTWSNWEWRTSTGYDISLRIDAELHEISTPPTAALLVMALLLLQTRLRRVRNRVQYV
ncbi:MAG: hypothetical protein R3E54_12195 [Halioglobus sp.]